MNAQQRIRELMQDHNWTEYRLAKECGLSQATISNLFRRNNAPSLSTLEAICRAFDITLAQFFSESGSLVELTSEQKKLFDVWLTLSPEKKRILLDLIQILQ